MLKIALPNRSRTCVVCGAHFVAGSTYYSQLEGEIRSDCCKECYQPKDGVIFWEGICPHKKVGATDLMALSLFTKSYAEGKKNVLFILALYLERKKQLVRRSSQSDHHLFEEPDSGALFYVQATPLTQQLLQEVDGLF